MNAAALLLPALLKFLDYRQNYIHSLILFVYFSPKKLEEDLLNFGFPGSTKTSIVDGDRLSEAFKVAKDSWQLNLDSENSFENVRDLVETLQALKAFLSKPQTDSNSEEVGLSKYIVFTN
jgi:hypothetical protein